MHQVKEFEVNGSPPPWTVTGVDKFIVSVIERAEREGGDLPGEFYLSLCPWGERNAVGGGAAELRDVMDPRFRLVHFTGCGRPYLLVFFIGDDARQRQRVAVRHLPWSEHYRASISDGVIHLEFIEQAEQPQEGGAEVMGERTLRALLRAGELASF